jgi:hypothetical protein
MIYHWLMGDFDYVLEQGLEFSYCCYIIVSINHQKLTSWFLDLYLCGTLGVYFLRHTAGGSALIDKWYEIRKSKQAQGFHDQVKRKMR